MYVVENRVKGAVHKLPLYLGLLYTLVEELQIYFGHFGCDCKEKSQSLCPESVIWIPFVY